jgi:hypothetical protein
MAVIINPRKPNRGHSKALPRVDLHIPARLYIGHLQSYYNLSHSGVYFQLQRGLIPKADGRIGKRQYWRTDTIKADLEK